MMRALFCAYSLLTSVSVAGPLFEPPEGMIRVDLSDALTSQVVEAEMYNMGDGMPQISAIYQKLIIPKRRIQSLAGMMASDQRRRGVTEIEISYTELNDYPAIKITGRLTYPEYSGIVKSEALALLATDGVYFIYLQYAASVPQPWRVEDLASSLRIGGAPQSLLGRRINGLLIIAFVGAACVPIVFLLIRRRAQNKA